MTARILWKLEGLRRDVVELLEGDSFAGRDLRIPEAGERRAEVLAAVARAPDWRGVVEVAERRDDVERRQDLPRQRIADHPPVLRAEEPAHQVSLLLENGLVATDDGRMRIEDRVVAEELRVRPVLEHERWQPVALGDCGVALDAEVAVRRMRVLLADAVRPRLPEGV